MEAFTENRENFEKLFLFEFLVDHVSVYNSKLNLDKQTVAMLGPVAVRFQFLNYPPIEVNEESFTAGTKPLLEETKIPLKSGKSCMFSLSLLKSQKVMNQTTFDVYITVYRYKLQKYTPGQELEKPEEVFIGRTVINIGDVFKDLFNAKQTSKRLAYTKTAANKLIDSNGEEVGKLMFLIRVSCFGFMVMTGFQLPEEEQKDFKYKNIDYDAPGEPAQKDRKESENTSIKCDQKSKKPCEEGRRKEKEKNKEKDKDREKDKGKGDGKKKDRRKHRSEEDKKRTGSDDTKVPPPCPFGFPPCPCVCRGQQQQGQISFSGQLPLQPMLGPYGSGQVPSVTSTQPASPNKARDMDIDPGAVGIRGNQLVFKMPDKQTAPKVPVEGKFASSVYYKMEDETQNGARNVIQILPKNPNEAVDKSKVDEKQDVLILKLGKKRLAAGKKPKLELELRTPKMKEDKPPMEAKDTQYLESDIPKPPKSASSAGKGGKGGKGGAKGGKKKK